MTNTQRKTCNGKTRAERIAQYAQQDTREQQTLDVLRAIADTAHILEAQGTIDNVYAFVRQKANASALQFITSQLHDAILQSSRDYHALNTVRAELRAMVAREERIQRSIDEKAEELTAFLHAMVAEEEQTG